MRALSDQADVPGDEPEATSLDLRHRPLVGGLAAIVGGGVAYALNTVPIYVVDGAAIVFGGIVTLGVALRFGGLWGALAAAIGFLPTLYHWEQPIALALAIIEAGIVGALRRRPIASVQRVHTAFWGVAAPLTLGTYYYLWRGITLPATTIIVLKSIGNAGVALVLASLMLAMARVLLSGDRAGLTGRAASLRDYFIGASAVALAVPAIVATLVISRVFESRVMREEAEAARALSIAVATSMRQAMVERQDILEGIAAHLGGGTAVRQDAAQAALVDFGGASQSFLTMLVTDDGGQMVAGFSLSDPATVDSLRRSGFNVSDRAYFRVPQETGQGYISDPFIGRGFGADRIFAVSVPILGGDGRFLGVVEGSVSTASLRVFVGNVPAGYDVAVLSRGRRVITATNGLDASLAPYDSIMAPLMVSEPFGGFAGYHEVLLERRDTPQLSIAQQSSIVGHADAGNLWQVIVSRAVGDALAPVRSLTQLATLGAVVAFLFLRLVFGRVLRDVLRPLDLLTTALSPVTAQSTGPEPVAPQLTPSAPREVVVLAEGFDAMQRALDVRFRELGEAVAQRDAFNHRLEQTLEGLDELVNLRTQELEAALNEARRASAVKAEFLASMSHELRTPLNAVVGSVDTLREGLLGPLTEAQRRSLDSIELGAEHLLALIGDVLDMERIAAGRLTVHRERVDVRALVERVRASVQPLASTSQLEFHVHLPSGALYIDGDALRLQQVLLNLLGNAVKFTPAGGSVTLRVLTGHVPGRVRRFEVEDSGIGIPEDQRARIFEPFAQVESGHTRRFGGTGLGLSISKALCDAMGVRLVIERSGPDGTVFAVIA